MEPKSEGKENLSVILQYLAGTWEAEGQAHLLILLEPSLPKTPKGTEIGRGWWAGGQQ